MNSDITTPVEPIAIVGLTTRSSKEVGTNPNSSGKWGDRVEEAAAKPDLVPKIDPKKSWAANARVNRDPAKGMELKFFPPGADGMAEISEYDIKEGKAVWKNAVVGYILGERPNFKEVVGFTHRSWGRSGVPRVHFLKLGYFCSIFPLRRQRMRC